jgi:hypothetical protein
LKKKLNMSDTTKPTVDKDGMVNVNQADSAKNEKIGEGEIKKYDEVIREHKPKEDLREISSTDDV